MNARRVIGRAMRTFFIPYGVLVLFIVSSRISRIIRGMDSARY